MQRLRCEIRVKCNAPVNLNLMQRNVVAPRFIEGQSLAWQERLGALSQVTQGSVPSASPSTSPKPFALLIVADGMGGQAHGQEASRLAVRSLAKYVSGSLGSQQMKPGAVLALLTAGVQYANQLVYQHNREQRDNMGTTMTVALVMDNTAYVAHVGDSRLYLYREPRGLAQI